MSARLWTGTSIPMRSELAHPTWGSGLNLKLALNIMY